MSENAAGIANQMAQAQLGLGVGEIGQLRSEAAQLRAELDALRNRLFGGQSVINPRGNFGIAQGFGSCWRWLPKR